MGLKADKTSHYNDMTGVYTAMGLKADKTYVDSGMTGVYTAMGLKADKTYVDNGMTGVYTAMGFKTDKTYVDTGMTGVYTSIGLKADKTYVDTTIRAISTNLDNYNTSNNNNFANFGTSISNLTSFVNTKVSNDIYNAGMTGVYTAIGLKADKIYVDSGMTGVYTAMGLKADKTYVDQTLVTTVENINSNLNLKAGAFETEMRDSSTFLEKNGADVIVGTNLVKVSNPRSTKGFYITSKTGHPSLKTTVPGIYRFNNVDTTLASYVPPKPVIELETGNINGTDGNFSGKVNGKDGNFTGKFCIGSTCIVENDLIALKKSQTVLISGNLVYPSFSMTPITLFDVSQLIDNEYILNIIATSDFVPASGFFGSSPAERYITRVFFNTVNLDKIQIISQTTSSTGSKIDVLFNNKNLQITKPLTMTNTNIEWILQTKDKNMSGDVTFTGSETGYAYLGSESYNPNYTYLIYVGSSDTNDGTWASATLLKDGRLTNTTGNNINIRVNTTNKRVQVNSKNGMQYTKDWYMIKIT